VQVLSDTPGQDLVFVAVTTATTQGWDVDSCPGHVVMTAHAATVQPGKALVRYLDALATEGDVIQGGVALPTLAHVPCGLRTQMAEGAGIEACREGLSSTLVGVTRHTPHGDHRVASMLAVLEGEGAELHLPRPLIRVTPRRRAGLLRDRRLSRDRVGVEEPVHRELRRRSQPVLVAGGAGE
jgi:hypothetical protein